MHRLGGQQHGEIHPQLPVGADRAQLHLAAAVDHLVEHRVEGELIFAGPFRDTSRRISARWCRMKAFAAGGELRFRDCSRRCASVRDRSPRRVDRIALEFFAVVLAERLAQRLSGSSRSAASAPASGRRSPPSARPRIAASSKAGQPRIVCASSIAVSARRRTWFRKVLVRMALRVPEPQMLDEIAARRIRAEARTPRR